MIWACMGLSFHYFLAKITLYLQYETKIQAPNITSFGVKGKLCEFNFLLNYYLETKCY